MMFKLILLLATFTILYSANARELPGTIYSISDEESNSIKFSLKAYQTFFNQNENFVFSPFSLRVVYNVLYQVAFGSSETELGAVLFENYDNLIKNNVLHGQSEYLTSISAIPNIKVANKLYYPSEAGLHLSDTIRSVSNRLQSEYEHVDFRQQETTIAAINNWVENRTNGMIRDLVDSSIITPDTHMLFVNTVYFKAKWLNAYDPYDQKPYNFNSIDGTTKSIDFIHDLSQYSIAIINEFNVDVLELPYERDSGFVFWILLPHRHSSIAQLKSSLDKSLFITIKNSLRRHLIGIKFPLFEIESELDDKLIAPKAFSNSNFQVFSNENSIVDTIKQKAKIIVDLDGTEASAATVVSLRPASAMFVRGKPKQFIADRPFIYAVIHKNTLQPIFIGHFTTA